MGLNYDSKPKYSNIPYFAQRGHFTLVGPAWITGRETRDGPDLGARIAEKFLPSLYVSISMGSDKPKCEDIVNRVAVTKEEVSALESATGYIANQLFSNKIIHLD